MPNGVPASSPNNGVPNGLLTESPENNGASNGIPASSPNNGASNALPESPENNGASNALPASSPNNGVNQVNKQEDPEQKQLNNEGKPKNNENPFSTLGGAGNDWLRKSIYKALG